MALSRVEGVDKLHVGGLWALRRSDTLAEKNITHVVSVVAFSPDTLKNFGDEPWSQYGRRFRHLRIDVDDVDDADLLVELPAAVSFIHEGLQQGRPSSTGVAHPVDEEAARDEKPPGEATDGERGRRNRGGGGGGGGGVLVHCAAGKSRSVSVVIAYLLWRYPRRFGPSVGDAEPVDERRHRRRPRKDTARGAVEAALELVRRTRPMAEPNSGFMEQLALWWEMGCPVDAGDGDENSSSKSSSKSSSSSSSSAGNPVERHPLYQRWAYNREVQEHLAAGQAPSRLRFEDEEPAATAAAAAAGTESALRCKKCRRTLATSPFINQHAASPTSSTSSSAPSQPCPHFFIEPLSWMRSELERGRLSGRLSCPNERCGAAVGRYDWKGIRCACGRWVTPGLSLQRARVDEEAGSRAAGRARGDGAGDFGIRMPPGWRGGSGVGGGGAGRGGNL